MLKNIGRTLAILTEVFEVLVSQSRKITGSPLVGVSSSSQTPPVNAGEAPPLITHMSRREQKSCSWIPMGLKTRN
jgi:hypothetical protein